LTGLFTGGKKGLGVEKKNAAFVFDYDGVNVLHLGAMTDVPTKAEIEAFGTVGVALVPVGGGSGLSAAKAAEAISMIEPGIVIPMHYQIEESKADISPLEKFLKEMGMSKEYTAEPSLKIKVAGIPEETQIVILEPTLK
jgi:L-ascorbate metabolism protein UlaG (beta-lactamase superfamily)